MTTVPNNFFPGAKIRKYLNQDVNKSEISIFSLVINDQTTFMYQFKNENFTYHLRFSIAYFTYHFCFLSTILCFRRNIFCFSSTIFCFSKQKSETQNRNHIFLPTRTKSTVQYNFNFPNYQPFYLYYYLQIFKPVSYYFRNIQGSTDSI